MKKTILFLCLVLLTTVLSAQSEFKRGIIVGTEVSGSTLVAIDSITSVLSDYKFYHGVDTLIPYVPVVARVNLEDVALMKYLEFNAQTGTTYTLVLTDDAKLITMSNALANILTVPLNATVPFAVGTQITICSIGVGQTSIAATGGVTINSAGGALKLRVRYSSATLIKTATDTWLLIGDISV
jgi:hypothetical protein